MWDFYQESWSRASGQMDLQVDFYLHFNFFFHLYFLNLFILCVCDFLFLKAFCCITLLHDLYCVCRVLTLKTVYSFISYCFTSAAYYPANIILLILSCQYYPVNIILSILSCQYYLVNIILSILSC